MNPKRCKITNNFQKAGVMPGQSTVLRDFDTELQMQTSDQK